MKRIVLIVALTSAIAGCTTTPPAVDQPKAIDITKAIDVGTTHDTSPSGVVAVRTDKDGNWVNLVVVGSAPINGDTAADESRAYELALLDANRKLAEYTNNNIRTTRKATTLTSDVESTDGETPTTRRTITRNSSETTTSNANQLQRGLVVSGTSIRDGSVYVTLTASRDTVKTAKQIRGVMQ